MAFEDSDVRKGDDRWPEAQDYLAANPGKAEFQLKLYGPNQIWFTSCGKQEFFGRAVPECDDEFVSSRPASARDFSHSSSLAASVNGSTMAGAVRAAANGGKSDAPSSSGGSASGKSSGRFRRDDSASLFLLLVLVCAGGYAAHEKGWF